MKALWYSVLETAKLFWFYCNDTQEMAEWQIIEFIADHLLKMIVICEY
jgi:hypothetical protein